MFKVIPKHVLQSFVPVFCQITVSDLPEDFLVLFKLTVNSIWGVVVTPPPPNRKTIREKKNGKSNRNDCLQVLTKSSLTTFKTIFETLSALGACHVPIIEGVVHVFL